MLIESAFVETVTDVVVDVVIFMVIAHAFVLARVLEGFGGARKLREACRKNFHPVAPLKTSVMLSYDLKIKKVNEY